MLYSDAVNATTFPKGRLQMKPVFFALLLFTVAPVGSFASDPKSDVTAAYTAWDAAFNKRDGKTLAASYLPNAKPPSHEVASGPGGADDRGL
jgi:hypothetical protein